MAMNKKEQAEMEALRQERDMYRAMYISEPAAKSLAECDRKIEAAVKEERGA